MSTETQTEQTINLSTQIAPLLPFLRRFARALTGSQTSGDNHVAAVLEALIADRDMIDFNLPIRVALYKLFHSLWSSTNQGASADADLDDAQTSEVTRLTPRTRQMLLLTAVEEFTVDEAATILGVELDEARLLVRDAQEELQSSTSARVMIIEDEPIIALDIESIVIGQKHQVVGVADTHRSAVKLADETKPDLILADIQLADGSSGIDAVAEILTSYDVPVVFITSFPERLLTGERPEPTYLVTKPFRPETVETAIAQALFHRKEDA